MKTYQTNRIIKSILLATSIFASSLLTSGCKTTQVQPQPTPEVTAAPPVSVPQIQEEGVVEGPVPPTNLNILMPYYVRAGDSLSKIAKKIYGKAALWKSLAEVNKLSDPDNIHAGDVIYYTLSENTKEFSDKYENSQRNMVVVKKGETLSHIAKSLFGKASDWRVLWKENPHIQNPHKIDIGEEIYFRPKVLKPLVSFYRSADEWAQPETPIVSLPESHPPLFVALNAQDSQISSLHAESF